MSDIFLLAVGSHPPVDLCRAPEIFKDRLLGFRFLGRHNEVPIFGRLPGEASQIFTLKLDCKDKLSRVFVFTGLNCPKKLLTKTTDAMRTRCEQCGWTSSNRPKKQAERALRMHQGRVHGNIKNGHDTKRHQDAPEGTNERKPLTEEQKERRRQYQRDRRAMLKAGNPSPRRVNVYQNGTSVELHHCPCCGLDLDKLAIALMAANKVV